MFRKLFLIATVLSILTVHYIDRAYADDMSDIKAGLIQLQKDVSELKGILIGIAAGAQIGGSKTPGGPGSSPQMPQEADTNIGNKPILGDSKAPITIVEFSDYECPFCAKFYQETLKQLKKEYIDTGKVRFIYRDFPLDLHQNARKAAEAVNCAGEQNKYWQLHNAIFENQQNISDMDSIAKKAGIDVKKLNACIASKKHDADIEKDFHDGRSIGVGGTPTFVIGKTSPDGSVKGKQIPGALPFGVFKAEIEALLKQQ